jgi:hypothetical protein
MKYQANPVIVDAFRIISIGATTPEGTAIRLEGNPDYPEHVKATPEMCSRMTPVVGDYWVIQSDGYIYLNPKDVFERKYHRIEANAAGAP